MLIQCGSQLGLVHGGQLRKAWDVQTAAARRAVPQVGCCMPPGMPPGGAAAPGCFQGSTTTPRVQAAATALFCRFAPPALLATGHLPHLPLTRFLGVARLQVDCVSPPVVVRARPGSVKLTGVNLMQVGGSGPVSVRVAGAGR